MTDIEVRIDAGLNVGSFRSEWQKLVREVEKPLRQVSSFRALEDDLDRGARAAESAKGRIRDLGNELARTANPSRELQNSYKSAVTELQRLERAQSLQKSRLSTMRTELQGAGIDTKNLASEQARLRGELSQRLSAGAADAALGQSMGSLGIDRLRQLQAQLRTLPQDYARVAQAGFRSAQEQAAAQVLLQRRLAETRREISDLTEAQGGGGLRARAAGAGDALVAGVGVGALGAVGATASIAAYVSATDEMKKLNAQLRLATDSQEEFNSAQSALKGLAQENQAPLASLYQLYARISPAMREAGKSQSDTLGITEAVTAAMRISGATAEESENSIMQFAQALGAGALRGDEFNSVAEQSPRLMRALADGIGVTRGALKGMADDGKLTTDVVVTGLLKALPELREEASQLPATFEGSMTLLKNEAIGAADAVERLTGFTEKLAGRVGFLSSVLGRASNYLDQFDKKGFKGLEAAVSKDTADHLAEYWINRIKAIRKAQEELAQNGRVSISSFASLGMWDKSQLDEALQVAEQHAESSRQLQERVRQDQEGALTGMARDIANYNASASALRRDDISNLKSTADSMVAAAKKRNQQLAEQERNALSASQQAYKDRLDIQQKYKETYAQLTTVGGDASYGAAQQLKVSANAALMKGDAETALRQAEKAREMLLAIQQQGGNTYGLAGFAKGLEQIELAANDLQRTKADDKLKEIRDKIQDLKSVTDEVKNLTITPKLDDKAADEARAKVKDLAKALGAELILTIPINPTPEMKAVGVEQTPGKVSFPGAKGETPTATIPATIEPTVDVDTGEKVKEQAAKLGNGADVPVKVKPYFETGENSFSQFPAVEVATQLNQEKVAETKQQIDQFANSLQPIEQPVIPKFYASADGSAFSQFPTAATPDAGQGFDVGGYTGPGGKYEPAGVVHRGEHVQPQEVVREPGALGFLERVRLYGFRNTMEALRGKLRQGWRGYDTGGLVSPRPIPSIPALAPALTAGAGGGDSLGTVVLQLDGKSYSMQASSDQFTALHRESLKKGHRRT
ncbi:tape measure protein [Pseudomonas sp. LA21]|uniref:tape measure protein n=1 Tax=Pseudomonas sp. LA21 TaxID=2893373 RepID=UPI001FB5E8ED|nr:tape measure protein [Pseudomonas sp. LA21]MCJ1887424.1 tape measure protein [Pseudomonas sp. LA21]